MRNLWLPPLLFLLMLPVTSFGLTVGRLQCESAMNPIGIGNTAPGLSWQLQSNERGVAQTAYQILVASSEKALAANTGDMWDTGKVASDQSIHVIYGGKPLQSRMRCYWKVRVWDKSGKSTSYSAPAYWEMGLLKPEDWRAKWIQCANTGIEMASMRQAHWIWYPTASQPQDWAPRGRYYFTQAFDVPSDRKITHCRMWVTAEEYYSVTVNGKQAGEGHGLGAIKDIDLDGSLAPGKNIVSITADNKNGAAGLLCCVQVQFESGEPLFVVTDRTWQAAKTAGGEQVAAFDCGVPDPAWRLPSQPMGSCQYARKPFVLAKPVRQAKLYMTALGLYEPYVNGQRIGDDLFSPGFTKYQKRVQYQTYDVTDYLRKGDNCLGFILADGWYSGWVFGRRNRFGEFPKALCQLVVEYADGSNETIATDERWKTSTGPLLQSDLCMGEVYDARKELGDWSRAGFDDKDWDPVVVKLVEVQVDAQRGPAVRCMRTIRPISMTQPRKGVYVFDLGQNMVGHVRLKVKGSRGTQVTLRHAEMLQPNGMIYTENLRGAKAADHYTLKGKGTETYEPKFTFHGFRYVEITGYPGEPSLDAVTGCVVYSDMEPTGEFECSNPLVDKLQSNIIWGQRGNFLSIPTDCPQRDERMGWTGDAQVFCRTATFNMDVEGFFSKWLVDLDDSQADSGGFPDMAPHWNRGPGSPGWGDAGVICPWTMYLCYGDKRVIKDHYDAMAKWIAYCKENSKDLIRPDQGYGDWLSMGEGTPKEILSTAYFAYSTRLLSKMAKAVGKDDDAATYEKLFQDVKAAFNKEFVQPDSRIRGDTQTAYVIALYFDLLPEDKRAVCAGYLVDNIRKRGRLSTGFLGVSYLLPALEQSGNLDTAYQLLNNDTMPSWLYPVKHGATTIWERWDGWTEDKGFQNPGMNSFNHYAYGSVGEWLYSTVAGIAPDPANPGYKHIIIRPLPGGGITQANATYHSPYGKIISSWRVEDGVLKLDVTVPPNATAAVCIPANSWDVKEGGKPAGAVDGIKITKVEGDTAVYEVGSGTYHFSARLSN